MSNLEQEIGQFLVWVMANRDVPTTRWAEEIEPELRQQLSRLIEAEANRRVVEELKQIAVSDSSNIDNSTARSLAVIRGALYSRISQLEQKGEQE